ncbi:MAG TPA: thiamine phosphate synthase [Planctomycetota bacterium]|nr:thiamine phosphate synthase [Planctomycetota bacterium]
MRPPRLVALSPGTLGPGEAHAFTRDAGRAVERGLRGILLREPALGDREYLALAMDLRALLAPHRDAWLGLHDRPHLATAVGAQAVHLGWRSLAPREIRPWLDESVSIGLSTHAGDDPHTWQDADYLLHGPVFAVDKPFAREPVGFEGLRMATARSTVAVWALGGLKPEHARDVLAAGAAGVATLSGIFGAEDAAAATGPWLEALAQS